MKVVTRIVAAFAVLVLVLPLMASPVRADASIRSMTVRSAANNSSISSGVVGAEVYLEGTSYTNDAGFVYFELDDDEWILVLEDDDWDPFDDYYLDEEEEGDPDYFEFQTDPFEIPECIGGQHRIAVLESDEGDTIDDDDVSEFQAGGSVAIKTFTVVPQIAILSDDEEGPAGTEVEVKGTGFGYREAITIYFDGEEVDLVNDITANDVGTWTGEFIVPPSSQGKHDITAGGDDTDEDDVDAAEFEVTPGISITPTSGLVGSQFTVSGSGFRTSEKSIEILFDGKSVKTGISADSDGVFQTTVTVPAAAMGNHKVDAKGQTTTASTVDDRTFEVKSQLLVEPLTGDVGTEITVTGTGLPASTAVTVSYDGTTKGTGTTSADGTLSGISFAATHTQTTHTADHPIIAMFDSTSLTETFVMESTPPAKPTPRTPLSGTRIGIIGKQTPTLTWSVVEDPSGVTYGLQISATPDFSQILISKSGMVAQGTAIVVATTGPEMSYTLTEPEALPYGTYYWRVKAIDGAMNDSGWSASSTFKAGLLPSWALIVIIVLAAILIAALIYVLIIRDRVGLYD
jgi:hypothetical protein